MNRSVEQALTSLIPRHNGVLPPELVDLASSILAQSRNKASNLKADEEIGRTYACANIACERLKQTLNLPKIEPRPPCPPRIYSKLYSYLDNLLVTQRKRTRTSSAHASTPSKPLPSRATPTKATSLAAYRTTATSTSHAPSSSRKHNLQVPAHRAIPFWIPAVTRALCHTLEAPAAIPHIIAGITSVLTLPSPRSEDSAAEARSAKKDKVPALLAAIFFFVTTRLSGRATNEREYPARRQKAVQALRAARADEALEQKLLGRSGHPQEVAAVWDRWEEFSPKDVDTWLLEISTAGWLRADWFENIVQGSGLLVRRGGGGEEGEDDANNLDSNGDVLDGDAEAEAGAEVETRADADADADGEVETTTLQSGLGTMMQDRVDYLSEKRRAKYAVWKQHIMARIEAMEAPEIGELDEELLGLDAMDV